MERRTKTTIVTWLAILTGVAAAAFWCWSALISIPSISPQWDADYSPLTSALRRQSSLSGVAAVLTGVSVFCQAIAQYLGKEA